MAVQLNSAVQKLTARSPLMVKYKEINRLYIIAFIRSVLFLFSQSPSGNDFVENVKHKMWLKIALEDLEIIQCKPWTFHKKMCTYR